MPDDDQALNELFRILKIDGWGILMAPIMPHIDETLEDPTAVTEADRWRLFGQGDYVRLYSKKGFLRKVEKAGFEVWQLGKDDFEAGTFSRCGITAQSTLYVVVKPS